MFKINEPRLNELNSIKYSDIKIKEKLENFAFDKENILLNSNVDIKSCMFSDIVFDKASIKFSNIEDTIFINCDLSNISFMDIAMYRVKFINCKLYGASFIDSNINDLIISDSMCNLINLATNKLNNVKFINSSFRESRMLECAMKNVIIDNIDFSKSEIINTPLNNIDLSTSKIDSIKTDLKSIKGMIVDYHQSMDLIGLLGIKIKE